MRGRDISALSMYKLFCFVFIKILCAIGSKLSLWIYLVQAFVIDVGILLGKGLGISENRLFQIAMPVFVCLSVIALAVVIETVVKNGLCRK